MAHYWFARYKLGPGRTQSKGLVPLNWKGVAVIAGFVAGLVVGGLAFLLFGLRDQFFPGIACFVILAAAGAITFLWASVARTDPTKSVADYRVDGVLK